MKRRCRELGALLLLAVANVGTELLGRGKLVVVGTGVVVWALLLARRQQEEPGFWRAYLRWPKAWQAPAVLLFSLSAAALAFGILLAPRPQQWMLMTGAYLPWGVAQQYLLNGVLADHLRQRWPRWGGLGAAALFALAHAPDWPTVAVVFPTACFWVWVFQYVPNLGLLGLAHALAGTAWFAGAMGRNLDQALAATLR